MDKKGILSYTPLPYPLQIPANKKVVSLPNYLMVQITEMPYREPKIERLQYAISEVAKMFGENISTIRYWSDKFEGIINPVRNNKRNRMFSPEDLETFKIIYYLVKEQNMTLDGAKKRIIENRNGEQSNAEIVNRLENIKLELLEIKKMI
jgi:DNA-binding transcriptional MerR regulator